MGMVKVWNDNVHPYKEVFMDREIKIPPKSFIKMEEGEAHLFKGTFAPIQVDGDGNPIPEGFKMIRLEKIEGEEAEEAQVNPLICNACSYEAASEKDLEVHSESSHKQDLAYDAEAEAAIAAKKRQRARKAS